LDGVVDSIPLDDFNQRVDEQTEFLEERVSKLNCLVIKLNILAELTSQELDKHLSLESRMPRLLDIL
jgi:hypothetical protein